METGKSETPEVYPLTKPFATEHLAVGDGHSLFIQQFGNPKGIPVMYLHGGPGGGCDAKHAQLFDPKKYHIILHDQRGGGKSTPSTKENLKTNTTQHLIGDIEKIRTHFGYDKVLLCGISWGSTLALAYAQQFPARVLGLALGAIFLGERWNLDWMCRPQGAAKFFPAEYRVFLDALNLQWDSSTDEIITTLNASLTHGDEAFRNKAIMAWLSYLDRVASPAWQPPAHADDNAKPDWEFLTRLVQIDMHYILNDYFMQPRQLLFHANQLRGISGVLVHGRYDMLCPVKQAYQLHQAWPESSLTIVQKAAHSTAELRPMLIAALDQFTLENGFNLAQQEAA